MNVTGSHVCRSRLEVVTELWPRCVGQYVGVVSLLISSRTSRVMDSGRRLTQLNFRKVSALTRGGARFRSDVGT